MPGSGRGRGGSGWRITGGERCQRPGAVRRDAGLPCAGVWRARGHRRRRGRTSAQSRRARVRDECPRDAGAPLPNIEWPDDRLALVDIAAAAGLVPMPEANAAEPQPWAAATTAGSAFWRSVMSLDGMLGTLWSELGVPRRRAIAQQGRGGRAGARAWARRVAVIERTAGMGSGGISAKSRSHRLWERCPGVTSRSHRLWTGFAGVNSRSHGVRGRVAGVTSRSQGV